MPRIIEELNKMVDNGFITLVEEPTEWVSSMVAAVHNGKLRICLDPRDFNKSIKREHYPMKTVEVVVSNIPKANLFSVLDAKTGFLQILLDEESSKLMTFNTLLGHLHWLRLPFAQKYFSVSWIKCWMASLEPQ